MPIKTPSMIKVKSSNIEAVGYDDKTSELHILFKNGGHYAYEGVSVKMYAELLLASSAGRFLSSHIKGTYKARKVN